jgi:hypothetical protein
MMTNRGCQAPDRGDSRHAVSAIATGRGRVARQAAALEGDLEILVHIIVVVLALAVAGGPLLAMRNPAEADKLIPGADPAHESGKEPDAELAQLGVLHPLCDPAGRLRTRR